MQANQQYSIVLPNNKSIALRMYHPAPLPYKGHFMYIFFSFTKR